MVAIAVVALCTLALALLGDVFHWAPGVALTHLALSVGVLPLILAAMSFFVPTLTRSRAPTPAIRLLPWCAFIAALAPVGAFLGAPGAHRLIQLGAGLAAIVVVLFIGWITQRMRRAVGAAHPCIYWYLAALACLLIALLAALASSFWPEHYLALRRVHLHLNVLGFVALTAVGTLQVLMPTIVQQPDPKAAHRLHRDIGWALTGSVLVALGAAWWKPLGIIGVAAWLYVLTRLAGAWWLNFRRKIVSRHGAAPSLMAALVGLGLLLITGALHGEQILLAARAVPAMFVLFLLPLVTGALSHLLPLWHRPQASSAAHDAQRADLQLLGGLRAVLFVFGGALLLGSIDLGYGIAAVALAAFALQAIVALWRTDGATTR